MLADQKKALFNFVPFQVLLVLVIIAAISKKADNAEAAGPDIDAGSGLTLSDLGNGIHLDLAGTDLVADPGTDTFEGTVDTIRIRQTDGTVLADITLPTATPLRDMVDAARSLPDPVTPGNTDPFNAVIMPAGSPFPNLFLTDSDDANAAMGFGGDDVFNMNGGGDLVYLTGGNDTFNGGAGKDTISAEFLGHSVIIDLGAKTATFGPGIGGADPAAHHAGTTSLSGVENATGSALNDTIKGNSKSNLIKGGDGDDQIHGGKGGANKLSGQDGNDTIRGGNDAETIDGGADNDIILGRGGDDLLRGSAGRDTISGQDGKDTIEGGAKGDLISGGARKDAVKGDSGNDTLMGDGGNDLIRGGGGKDHIVGGIGNDALSGGVGGDTFVFSAGDGDDRIRDFEVARDMLRMDGIAPGAVSVTAGASDTTVNYGSGTVVIEGLLLTAGDITFEFV